MYALSFVISGRAIKKCFKQIFLVFGGLHVPISLNLKKCFLRKKIKVTLTFLNDTICF